MGFGTEVIGHVVEIFQFDHDQDTQKGHFYRGVVKDCCETESDNRHFIIFDDGEEDWFDLDSMYMMNKLRWGPNTNVKKSISSSISSMVGKEIKIGNKTIHDSKGVPICYGDVVKILNISTYGSFKDVSLGVVEEVYVRKKKRKKIHIIVSKLDHDHIIDCYVQSHRLPEHLKVVDCDFYINI